MKTQEIQETQQTQVLTNLEKIEKAVNEFIEKNNVSPFIDIRVPENTEESNRIEIDMDEGFEKEMTEIIGEENLTEAFSEYFTKIIKDMLDAIEDGTAPDFITENMESTNEE